MPHLLINQGCCRSPGISHMVLGMCVRNPILLPGSRQENSPWNTWNLQQGSQKVSQEWGKYRRQVQFGGGIFCLTWSKPFNWGSLGLPVLISTGMKSPCFVSEVHTAILKSVILSLRLNFQVSYAALGKNTQLTIFSNLMTFYLRETTCYQYTIP